MIYLNVDRDDVVMFRSGGMYATLRSCYTVASRLPGGVDDNVSVFFLCSEYVNALAVTNNF